MKVEGKTTHYYVCSKCEKATDSAMSQIDFEKFADEITKAQIALAPSIAKEFVIGVLKKVWNLRGQCDKEIAEQTDEQTKGGV